MRARPVVLASWLIVSMLMTSLSLLPACSPGESTLGISGWQAPGVTSVSPASGSQNGGDRVTLSGSNFEGGARVFFGQAEGKDPQVISRASLSVTTPSSPVAGDVEVYVMNADGQKNKVPATFHFDAAGLSQLEQSAIANPALQRDVTGAEVVPVTIAVEVAAGSTQGAGRGRGVRVVAGFLPMPVALDNLGSGIWSEATYVADFENALLDRYELKVNLPGVSGNDVKDYVLLAQVSVDDGATWTLTDRDGSANGATLAQLPRVLVSRGGVDFCRLGGEIVESPPQLSIRVGMPGPVVTAQVGKIGVTSNPGAGEGVVGQLGYGPPGSLPSDGSWAWSNALFSQDTGGGANDEFRATLPNPGVGTFAFGFRFSVNSGPYLHCDADGSDANGFTSDQAGTLTVTQPNIDSCKLVPPSTHLAQPNAASGPLAARVTATAVTDAPGAGAGVTGELGYGPVGSRPGAGWVWLSAGYASDQDDNRSDEYRQRAPALAAGQYDIAFRFRYANGANVLCDLDGSANGYNPAQAFKLTVAPAALQSCKLASATTTTVASGARLSVFGRARVGGITEGVGAGSGVRGQVGIGNAGTNASTAGWTWRDAIFYGDITETGEDELRAELQPALTGARALSFRVSLNNGETWSYCDLNGSDVGGYEVTQQLPLTVNSHADLDYCGLQGPATATQRITPIVGRVQEPGLTDVAGEPPGLYAELGAGPANEDPGVSLNWKWKGAGFSAQVAGQSEFKATLGLVAPTGTSAYAFRFARSLGAPLCYGDLNGQSANNGFATPLGQATLP